jgi:hypothetical protein
MKRRTVGHSATHPSSMSRSHRPPVITTLPEKKSRSTTGPGARNTSPGNMLGCQHVSDASSSYIARRSKKWFSGSGTTVFPTMFWTCVSTTRNTTPGQARDSIRAMLRLARRHCSQLVAPVRTSFPDVNSRAVQLGSLMRMVMAANRVLS